MALWEDFKTTLRRWFLGQSAAEGGVKLKETPTPDSGQASEPPKPQKEVVEPEIVMPKKTRPPDATSSEIAFEFATSLVKTFGQIMQSGLDLAKKQDPKSLPAQSASGSEREPD